MVSALLDRLRRDSAETTRVVYPWELPSIMRKHIVTGAMGTVYFSLISGVFLVAFGGQIGLQPWHWGILSSAASFTLTLQLLSAHVVGRTGNRRTLWFLAALAARLLRGVAIALGFYCSLFSYGAARVVFIGLLVLATAADAIAAPPWLSWLRDLIPHDQHGHFMGRRSAWTALASVCVVVPAGLALDLAGPSGRNSVLLLIFAVAVCVGILDLLIHRTIPVPPMELADGQHFWHDMLEPLRDERFRRWLAFNGAWTFSMTLGGTLAMVHFVENLGLKRNFLGGSVVLVVLPLLGTIIAGRRLGRMVDTRGVRRALHWGHRLWALLPLFWILATPNTALWWLGAAALLGGVASTAAFTAAGKLTTRLPERARVPMYTAVSTCVGSLAGALGPATAGFVLYRLRDFSWQVGALEFTGFHILFAASFVLRNLSVLMIRGIPEPSTPAKTKAGEAA